MFSIMVFQYFILAHWWPKPPADMQNCFNVTHSNNLFPNKPWFLRVCRTSLLKTLREKEKLLITSNFSFSHSVFYPFGEHSAIFFQFQIVVCKLFQFGKVQNLLFGKGITEISKWSCVVSYQLTAYMYGKTSSFNPLKCNPDFQQPWLK